MYVSYYNLYIYTPDRQTDRQREAFNMDMIELELTLSTTSTNQVISRKRSYHEVKWEDEEDKQQRPPATDDKLGHGEEPLLGWPPLTSHFCRHNYYNNRGRGRGNSMYVKVLMDGVGIGRKLNLRRHTGYPSLSANIFALFGTTTTQTQLFDLVYQDRDGHWFLARDVPWE